MQLIRERCWCDIHDCRDFRWGPEDLVAALDLANKGQNPRVTKSLLDSYIEDPDTDIDQLFEDTLDFLEKANVTKKIVKRLKKRIAEEKAKAEAANQN